MEPLVLLVSFVVARKETPQMLQHNPTSLCARTANSTALLLVGKIGLKKCAPRSALLEKCVKVLSGRQPENAPDSRRFRGALSTFRSDTFHMENVLDSAQPNQEPGTRDRLISPNFSVPPKLLPEKRRRQPTMGAETCDQNSTKQIKTRSKLDLNST